MMCSDGLDALIERKNEVNMSEKAWNNLDQLRDDLFNRLTPGSAFDGFYARPGVGFWRLLSLNSFSRDAIFLKRIKYGGNEALTYWQWIVGTSGMSFHWHFSRKRSFKVCVHDLCTKCLRCRRASENLRQSRSANCLTKRVMEILI